MLASALFMGDVLLQAVADDRDRISATQHRDDPAVEKLQLALLDWDPNCLPRFGADGQYGGEMEAAVARFKEEVLAVPAAEIIRDVGPKTVLKLDEMQAELDAQRGLAARTALLDDWLGAPTGFSSAPENGSIVPHPSGDSAFAALNAALARCVDEQALVLIAGWDFYDGTPLAPGVTAGDALRAAAGRGARVRGLFAHFPVINVPLKGPISPLPGNNTGSTAFVNGLPNGAAIHDALVLHHILPGITGKAIGPVQIGMHHQKAWVVFDGTRLTAFCGGIDINPNRTTLSGHPPLHDVQLEIDGAPAHQVYEVLRERWNTHPQAPAGVALPAIPAPAASGGLQRARVVTTFGDPTKFVGLGPVPGGAGSFPAYPFAPTGSKAYRDLLSHLIDKAERFIYVEDQYLVDEETAVKLAAAMSHIQALIMVFCDSNAVNNELHQTWARRKRFLDHLAPHSAKVAMVAGKRFIHAKTWVFDDMVALVGSANMNRRGYKHDSEIGVGFGDLVEPGQVKSLRTQLWATQLGAAAPSPTDPPESALPLWQAPPATSNVFTYNPTAATDTAPVAPPLNLIYSADEFWDNIIDPDSP